MSKALNLFYSLLADRRGISAVEYGILIGVVGVGLVGALTGIAGDINTFISDAIGNLTPE